MQHLNEQQFQEFLGQGSLLIDTRASLEFVQGFFPHSIHIPASENFLEIFELVATEGVSVILLGEEEKVITLSKLISKTGFLGLKGYVFPSILAGKKKDILIDISAEEFRIDYNFDEFFLIDVRPEDVFEQQHIEYAENISLLELHSLLIDMDASQLYYIYGNNFEEAVYAASIFKRHDFQRLRVVAETYETIKLEKLPMVKGISKSSKKDFSKN